MHQLAHVLKIFYPIYEKLFIYFYYHYLCGDQNFDEMNPTWQRFFPLNEILLKQNNVILLRKGILVLFGPIYKIVQVLQIETYLRK